MKNNIHTGNHKVSKHNRACINNRTKKALVEVKVYALKVTNNNSKGKQ